MSKDIKTAEAKLELVKKFLDYAIVANASYAMLNYIWKNAENETEETKADGLTFKHKLEYDVQVRNPKGELITKKAGTNTAYACAIEARFAKDKIYKTTLGFINSTLDNNPANVSLDAPLSQETIEFTNRYRLLHHQPNTASGFSGTLFLDTQDSNQKIIVFRGTEFPNDIINDILDADKDLAFGILPNNQYLDMLKFYLENL